MGVNKWLQKHMNVSLGYLLICLVVLIFTVICFYPFLYVVAMSFSSTNAILSGKVVLFPVEFQLTAYEEILKKKQIWDSIKVTIESTLFGTALSLALTILAAYSLSKKGLKGRKILSGLILFTMYFGGGIIPTLLVVKGIGLYDTVASLYIPNAISVFNFIVIRTFFRELPPDLEEAAFLDGANHLQILSKVVMPLSKPIIATIGLFYAVGYWNDYFSALLYIQDPTKYSLQLRLRSLLFTEELNTIGAGDMAGTPVMAESLKMASIVVGTIPIILIYPWLQKYFVKGVMLGSVKG